LADDRVRTIAIAPDNIVWIGFDGAGVARYVPGD
jgi:hypothetical protein